MSHVWLLGLSVALLHLSLVTGASNDPHICFKQPDRWYFCGTEDNVQPPAEVKARYQDNRDKLHICHVEDKNLWVYCVSLEVISKKDESVLNAADSMRKLCDNSIYGAWFYCDNYDLADPPEKVMQAYRTAHNRLVICFNKDKKLWYHCNTDEEIAKE